jgi:hypothetical protein
MTVFASSRFLDAKHLSTMIIAVLILSGLAYLLFFR